ncbi:cilia- and flagella-associated protein 251 isoform X1 [Hydra vulgaris]|uniref:cilia- and flagella-associated protein 251 isoform X1 n=1 Tax=Hydra vulgaris TaxID=6087 RepID=UPI001F5FA618|nr:cilia- and flagella-associated protein 251 [Hydra vulgaris]
MDSEKNQAQAEESFIHLSTVLNLSWAFGINKNIPAINLSSDNKKIIFYAVAHTGILYDLVHNVQVLYQGHQNSISAICVSVDKKWLVTADIGPNSLLIVWDTFKRIPVRTIFNVDTGGVSFCVISSDAKYIAVLSSSEPQKLTIWSWTTESQVPIVTVCLSENSNSATSELMTYLAFNNQDFRQLVCNNKSKITFVNWEKDGNIFLSSPMLSDKDFNTVIGNYKQTVLHPQSNQAFTATDNGSIIVWSQLKNGQWKALKVVNIQKDAITTLVLWNSSFLVTGDVTGKVKFYDTQLKFKTWFENFGIEGSIIGISFTSESDKNTSISSYKNLAEVESSFTVADFVITTDKSSYLYFKPEDNEVLFLRKESDKEIKTIACHFKDSLIAVGGLDGLLQIFDYQVKSVKHSKELNVGITALAYHPNGDYLAVGFENGNVELLNPLTLEVEKNKDNIFSFNFVSESSIMKIVYSHNGKYFACSTSDKCVIVFQWNQQNCLWFYLGKSRAHYKEVMDLMFMPALDEDMARLFSLSLDRMLVEYDLINSLDSLKVLVSDRIEQEAVPLCFIPYPPIVKENFFIVANDAFKIKLFNSTTKMCRQTTLSPAYGSQVKKMLILPDTQGPHRYMAYITSNKVGLTILPFDGNPYKSMALIAHKQAHDVACSFDGKYLFTCGGSDPNVLIWVIDYSALEAASCLGGDGLNPFYSLLEGGQNGHLFSELEDYFYFCQIRSQGIDTMMPREVSSKISLSEVPFLMRALGFYPTEEEIENMINEVKFSEYVDTGKCMDSLDLEDFTKLYLNHRPAFGLQISQVEKAFKTVTHQDGGEYKIQKEQLIKLLQEKGEHLNESEFFDCIMSSTVNSDNLLSTEEELRNYLPKEISFSTFIEKVLKFPELKVID